MPRQVVLKDSIQTLESYPKVRPTEQFSLVDPNDLVSPGVPRQAVSAECRVRTASETETAFAACTLGTLNPGTVAAADEGDTEITLTTASITIQRGHRFLLVLATGERLWVRAAAYVTFSTQTSKTLKLMSPLPCDVPTSSRLFGLRVSRALTLLETEVEGPAMIDWRLLSDTGAITAEWSEQFEIVRRMPRWELDEDELARRMPEIYAARDLGDVTLQETIEAALEEELLPRLRAKRDNYGQPIRESNIISTWALVPAHVAAVRLYLANNDPTKTKEQRDEARAEVLQKLDLAFEDADAWYDAPQTETPDVHAERGRFGVFRYTR